MIGLSAVCAGRGPPCTGSGILGDGKPQCLSTRRSALRALPIPRHTREKSRRTVCDFFQKTESDFAALGSSGMAAGCTYQPHCRPAAANERLLTVAQRHQSRHVPGMPFALLR
jgi:hypothetical protein